MSSYTNKQRRLTILDVADVVLSSWKEPCNFMVSDTIKCFQQLGHLLLSI